MVSKNGVNSIMGELDDRARLYETRFAHDEEMRFKAEARGCRKIGMWAASEIGLEGEAATLYAKEVIASNIDEPGLDDVKRKIMADFEKQGLEIEEHVINKQIETCMKQAKLELLEEIENS